jgi:hypothetical protein
MGVGLGAGVGGLAGAEGNILCGMAAMTPEFVPEDGESGICMARGVGRPIGAFRLLSEVGEGKIGGGGGKLLRSGVLFELEEDEGNVCMDTGRRGGSIV